ncbi:class D sortase [Alkalihalobacillus hemicellulosilyticus]|uniref:Sortase n=1 Tax=Halalkalibacter hemicellulosilyticusJCM 9152 TaxID=1236971 RepID=W4QF81_9BACI|nr:class D sortase [Halalkalibacter hemicellulosilyticus]GAE29979.1 sortase [Halalkalibacter hemicellulosilyticusJCM 9152]
MKIFANIIIIVGLALVIYSGYNIYDNHAKQNESIAQANELITKTQSDSEGDKPNSAEDMDIDQGDVIGILYIPRFDKELPIVSGTDEDELDRGVGHYTTTVLPGQGDQILLSGHRDTVFRGFGDLEMGDEFIVKMPYGEFTYVMYEDEIVDADDRTVIRSTAPDEILTLSTCYPFSFVGSAPDRYIVYAKPVEAE